MWTPLISIAISCCCHLIVSELLTITFANVGDLSERWNRNHGELLLPQLVRESFVCSHKKSGRIEQWLQIIKWKYVWKFLSCMYVCMYIKNLLFCNIRLSYIEIRSSVKGAFCLKAISFILRYVFYSVYLWLLILWFYLRFILHFERIHAKYKVLKK